ncbi:MAG: GtrA family protein [Lachnospiraceae bacterium]|nr:GtrA family protein [Lachnospiraceae bacterium]
MSRINQLIDKTFIRFIIVGVLNTIVGTGVMFAAYNIFHLSYWISSGLNYIIGSIVSYYLNKYFTFQYKKRDIKATIRFVVNIAICYLLAYGLAKPLVSLMLSMFSKTIQDNIAMLVGMCLFVCLNYMGQRFFVFKNR